MKVSYYDALIFSEPQGAKGSARFTMLRMIGKGILASSISSRVLEIVPNAKIEALQDKKLVFSIATTALPDRLGSQEPGEPSRFGA